MQQQTILCRGNTNSLAATTNRYVQTRHKQSSCNIKPFCAGEDTNRLHLHQSVLMLPWRQLQTGDHAFREDGERCYLVQIALAVLLYAKVMQDS